MTQERHITIRLELPDALPDVPLPELLKRRRSRRRFLTEPLSLDQVSVLLWAALGYRRDSGTGRTVPSAGAIYPVEIHLVTGEPGIEGLEAGVYRYIPQAHSIELTEPGDRRAKVAAAALSQEFLRDAPVIAVVSADVGKTTAHYGKRGLRYVHMDTGHVGQNIYLIAEALDLGTVAVGAFDDDRVARLLVLPRDLFPFYLMPLGRTP